MLNFPVNLWTSPVCRSVQTYTCCPDWCWVWLIQEIKGSFKKQTGRLFALLPEPLMRKFSQLSSTNGRNKSLLKGQRCFESEKGSSRKTEMSSSSSIVEPQNRKGHKCGKAWTPPPPWKNGGEGWSISPQNLFFCVSREKLKNDIECERCSKLIMSISYY